MKIACTRVVMTGAVVGMLVTPAVAQVYVYPEKGQSKERQSRDQYECHQWATQQTGFDPAQAQASPPAAPPSSGASPLRGAGRGAAIGAVGGAIGGNAGTGAAVGAATGALFGGMRRRDEQQAAAQAQASQAQVSAQGNAAYDRALAACLSGRGYTVR
jgi:hypothetical protein